MFFVAGPASPSRFALLSSLRATAVVVPAHHGLCVDGRTDVRRPKIPTWMNGCMDGWARKKRGISRFTHIFFTHELPFFSPRRLTPLLLSAQ